MRIADLNGKRVCILGFGKEGQAMLEALKKYAPEAKISIADANPVTCHPSLVTYTGDDYLTQADQAEILIKSPGIKPAAIIEGWRDADRLTSGTSLFIEEAMTSGSMVIGVTGSKGKSTTTSLIYDMLKASGKDAYLLGNIGIPAISMLDKIKPGAIFVMELSSYQLMDLTVSPEIAVVTSFFPDHLDYHGTLEAYRDAKANIARNQEPQDVIFYAAESEGAKWIAEQSKGERIPFSAAECPVPITETKLIGEHNRSNIAGAYMAAIKAGADPKKAVEAIKNFSALPHRLQSLGVHHGIEWVDDAISTTPESTIAALDALGDRVQTIILGGQDRGYDFTSLAQRLKTSSVKTAILFPGSGPKIRSAIEQSGAKIELIDATTMEKAITIAKQKTPAARSPQLVLLSCASPSYNMFKNFEEKGNRFRECILRKP